MKRLVGKTAIITGAARGTGEATARMFASEGANVVVADILEDVGRATAESIGASAMFHKLDVTSEVSWKALIDATVTRFGGVDILVNNAGVLLMKSIEDTTLADYQRVIGVNQIGTFLGMQAVAEAMKAKGAGSIVNVSSVDGLRGRNGLVAYVASKWAVRGMTRVAALELGRFGIRVNAVCPEAGSADMIKPFLPEGIDMEAVLSTQQPFLSTQKDRTVAARIDDVARMILFLASEDGASSTGADFIVDGGNSAGRISKGLPGS